MSWCILVQPQQDQVLVIPDKASTKTCSDSEFSLFSWTSLEHWKLEIFNPSRVCSALWLKPRSIWSVWPCWSFPRPETSRRTPNPTEAEHLFQPQLSPLLYWLRINQVRKKSLPSSTKRGKHIFISLGMFFCSQALHNSVNILQNSFLFHPKLISVVNIFLHHLCRSNTTKTLSLSCSSLLI